MNKGNLDSGNATNPYSLESIRSRANGEADTGRFLDATEDAPIIEMAQPLEIPDDELSGVLAVKNGLGIYNTGFYLLTFCWFLGGAMNRMGAGAAARLFVIGSAIGTIAVLIGQIKCLFAPQRSRGFLYVLGSVLVYAIYVLVFFGKQLAIARGGNGGMLFQLNFAQILLLFIANILFLTFIICFSEYLRNKNLYLAALKLRRGIWHMVIFVFFIFFAAIVSVQQGQRGMFVASIVLVVGVVTLMLLTYSWLQRFSRLVRQTAEAIVIER